MSSSTFDLVMYSANAGVPSAAVSIASQVSQA